MKKMIHVILMFFFCNAAFCQDPPDFGDPTDPNPTDQQAVPIDTQLPVLVIAAVFYGIYVIGRKKYSPFKWLTN
jgi:hypothetical protein